MLNLRIISFGSNLLGDIEDRPKAYSVEGGGGTHRNSQWPLHIFLCWTIMLVITPYH